MELIASSTIEPEPIRVFDDGIPRVPVSYLAERLEYGADAPLRRLLGRHIEYLEKFGTVVTMTTVGGNRLEFEEPWLSEPQALYLTAKSEKPIANDLTVKLVKMFEAYRNGRLQPLDHKTAIFMDRTASCLEALTSKVTDTRSDVAEIKGSLTKLSSKVEGVFFDVKRLGDKVADISSKNRRDILLCDLNLHIHTCHDFAGGKCPCCFRTVIVGIDGRQTNDFTIDHWNGKHNRNIYETWPVCRECNRRLDKELGFKGDHASEFRTYQNRLPGTGQGVLALSL